MANPAKNARDKMQAKWPGASVYSRGKKHITHQHPSDPNKFAFDTAIGPMHYGAGDDQEIDTAWEAGELADQPWLWKMVKNDFHAYAMPGNDAFDAGQIIRYVDPDSGEDITFQPQQLQWSNDLDQIEAIADPATISGTTSEDELTWIGAYGAGIDFVWQAQTARMAKRITIDALATIGPPPQFIIDGGNPYLKIPFIFQKSSGIEIWVDSVEWDETANNPQLTSGAVEFKSGADSLFYMTQPWASDESVDDWAHIQGQYYYRKTGPNLFVEIRIPWSWLETAVYPVVIDPTIDDQVGGGTDDTYRYGATGWESSGANRPYVGYSASKIRELSHRFTGISGLSGATIGSGSYHEVWNSAGTSDGVLLYADDAEAPTAPTSYGTFDGKSLTTANVAYDPTGFGVWYGNAVDISSVIQELADSHDPSAIQIMLKTGSSTTATRIHHFDYDSDTAPKLHIDYTAGGRTTKNTDAYGLGIEAGMSRTFKVHG